MNERITQEDRVRERIEQMGYVDNFWAIENYILRLGAIVYTLRKDGMELEGAFGKELGKEKSLWKNYYYVLKKQVVQNELTF
jgi:hypothetical protein